jgi:hypothetical protein
LASLDQVQEHAVKPRPPRPRKKSVRDTIPPEVPEVAGASPPENAKEPEPDPIPEHIRRMLEAAYT